MFSKGIKIKELMQKNPFCITEQETLDSITEIFKLNSFHHLIVLDEDGIATGIISRADVLYALEVMAKNAPDQTNTEHLFKHWDATRLMTHNPTTLNEEDNIDQAAKYFLQNNFHALPIYDNQHKLAGIITSHDLLAFAYS